MHRYEKSDCISIETSISHFGLRHQWRLNRNGKYVDSYKTRTSVPRKKSLISSYLSRLIHGLHFASTVGQQRSDWTVINWQNVNANRRQTGVACSRNCTTVLAKCEPRGKLQLQDSFGIVKGASDLSQFNSTYSHRFRYARRSIPVKNFYLPIG